MKIVGFGFNKIHAERTAELSQFSINNHIEFTNFEKEKADFFKDSETFRLNFKYELDYVVKKEKHEEKQAGVTFEGFLILLLAKEESKSFVKSWKKKELPKEYITPLYNFILRKCSTKSVALQEDINLPSPYLKFPQIKPSSE